MCVFFYLQASAKKRSNGRKRGPLECRVLLGTPCERYFVWVYIACNAVEPKWHGYACSESDLLLLLRSPRRKPWASHTLQTQTKLRQAVLWHRRVRRYCRCECDRTLLHQIATLIQLSWTLVAVVIRRNNLL